MPAFYADVLFAVNFFMNLFLLAAVKKVCRGLSRGRRLCVSAAFGAACAVGLALWRLPYGLYVFAGGLIVPAMMIFIAFGKENIEREVYYFITLYIMAFLAGGILTSVFEQFTFSNSSFSLNYHGIYKKTTIVRYVIACAALVLFWGGVCFLSGRVKKERHVVTAVLSIHGQRVALRALIDTGNGLYEPFSRQPVMVAERSCIGRYFKEEDMCAVRAVPFHSVGKRAGILYALPADFVEISELHVRHSPVMVALYDGCVGGGCQALLHPDMLN